MFINGEKLKVPYSLQQPPMHIKALTHHILKFKPQNNNQPSIQFCILNLPFKFNVTGIDLKMTQIIPFWVKPSNNIESNKRPLKTIYQTNLGIYWNEFVDGHYIKILLC